MPLRDPYRIVKDGLVQACSASVLFVTPLCLEVHQKYRDFASRVSQAHLGDAIVLNQEFSERLAHIHPVAMETAESVPPEVLQQVAEYFGVLSEPMRLRILNALKDRELCVQDLVEITSTSQANVSKHLKVMMQAGILNRRTEGTSAFYSVADDLIFELCNMVCDRLASRIEQQARHFRAFSLASKQ